MLMIVAGVVFGVPIIWALSVGALRDRRRARELGPRTGCQAWVAVSGLPKRRYRCCEPVYAGGPWCRRHEVDRSPAPEPADATLIDEHQAVGRAVVQARIGIPLAALAVLVTVGAGGWAL